MEGRKSTNNSPNALNPLLSPCPSLVRPGGLPPARCPAWSFGVRTHSSTFGSKTPVPIPDNFLSKVKVKSLPVR